MAAAAMSSVSAILDHFQVADALWAAFVREAGDPNDDLRLLAALPGNVVAASLAQATFDDGAPLTAVQAAQVGLVWKLARRMMFVKGGGTWEDWSEEDPWSDSPPSPPRSSSARAAAAPGEFVKETKERTLKFTQVLDQGDDGEFEVLNEEAKMILLQNGSLARRGGGAHDRATVSVEEEVELGQTSLLRLWRVRPVRQEGTTGFKIQDLDPYGGWLCRKGASGSGELHPVESLLSGLHDGHADVGGVHAGTIARLRAVRGEVDQSIPRGLALGVRGGRDGAGRTFIEVEVKDQHGHEGRKGSPIRLRREKAMGSNLQNGARRTEILAGPGAWPGSDVVGFGLKRKSANSSGDHRTRNSSRRSGCTLAIDGVGSIQPEFFDGYLIYQKAGESRKKRSEEEKVAGRTRRAPTTSRCTARRQR